MFSRSRVLPGALFLFAAGICLLPSSALAAPPVFTTSFGSFPAENPQALAVDQASGDVYAIDASAGTVSRFDAAGNPVNFTAGPDAGTNTLTGFFFDGPSAAQVAIDNSGGATDGEIYVANSLNGTVKVFANDGTPLSTLDGTGNTNPDTGGEPCGVAVAPNADVYVGYFSGHIDRYVPSGSPVENADFDSEINEAGLTCNVAASNSTVYASSWAIGPLTSYSASIFPGGGGSFDASASGTVVDPVSNAVSLDPSTENVYVDEGNKIAVFDSTGNPLFSFGSESDFGTDSDGVAVKGSSGTAYVADRTNGEIDVFGPGTPPIGTVPSVTSVTPNKGPAAGGQTVTITGTDLTGVEEVNFGANPATGVVEISSTEIEVTSPSHAAGTVDVTVTTSGGTSATGAADEYTYVEAPTVTSVNPTKGSTAGGNTATVTGTNLQEATFKFGPNSATGVVINGGGTSATMTVPAGAAGTVDVRATTAGGESANTAADDYTYIAPPTVTNLAPNKGPTAGGNTVEITGTDLSEATKVEFGSTSVACPSAQCTIESSTQINVVAPPHAAGTVNVTVTAFGGISTNTSADEYTFSFLPFVISLEPAQGPSTGGNTVKITGVNLSGATEVEFGGNVVNAPFAVNTATKIELSVPAHAAGAVDVRVTTPGGSSPNTTADDYTYIGPPTVTTTEGGSSLAQTTATVAGSVNPNGGNVTECRVEYGLTAAYGSEANCASLPGSGLSSVGVSAVLGGLTANTTYHFRFKASNAGGTGTGSDQTLTTLADTCATKSSLCPPPSNEVKPVSAKRQGENVVLKIEVPGPGSLSATGKKMKKATAAVDGAGPTTLKLRLTSAGRKQLRNRGRLRIKVTISFTPVAGSPGTVTRSVTFKAKHKK